jgi:hypothetical protein
MSKYTYDPDIMADLDNEREYAASRDNSPRRLKLGKGERALVRILPVNLMADQAERRQWYARVGFHWYDKRFVICPRTTQPIFGGNPDARCPVCDVADKYVNDKDETVRKKASMASTFPNWLVYVLVWEFYKKGDDQPTYLSKTDQFVPHSFWLKRPSWLDVSDAFKRSLRRVPDFGILNPLEGYDIMLRKDMRGNLTIQREEDPTSISKSIKTFEDGMAYVDEIFSKVRCERLNPSSDKELLDFSRKLKDSLEFDDDGGRDERRSRSSVDEGDEDVPRSRRDDRGGEDGGERPRSRHADPDDDTPPPEDRPARGRAVEETREDEPVRRSAREEEPPARSSRKTEEDTREDSRDRRSQVDRDLDAEEPPPAARVTPPPSARVVTPPPASRVTPPPAARSVRPPPEDLSKDEDGDGVAPERHDPAPPAGDTDEPAPAQETKAAQPRPAGRLSDSLRSNIASLDRRR